MLTNLVTVRLDARLAGLAERYGSRYSRYVDDITFSAPGRATLERLLPKLEAILLSEGFALHPDKTRLQTLSMRQEVTGLVLSGARTGGACSQHSPGLPPSGAGHAHAWRAHGLATAAKRNGQAPDFEGSRFFVRQLQGRVAHLRHVNATPEVERYHADLLDLMAFIGDDGPREVGPEGGTFSDNSAHRLFA